MFTAVILERTFLHFVINVKCKYQSAPAGRPRGRRGVAALRDHPDHGGRTIIIIIITIITIIIIITTIIIIIIIIMITIIIIIIIVITIVTYYK